MVVTSVDKITEDVGAACVQALAHHGAEAVPFSVDTADVAPTALGVTGTAEWREDRVAASLPRDEVLRGAPAADLAAGLFKVPRVLGS